MNSDGYSTEYLHMAKGSVAVSAGDVVEKGQVLGYMGTTGWSTGNHLHFGIRINGSTADPEPYLLGTKKLPDYSGTVTVAREGRIVLDKTPIYISSTATSLSNRLSGVYYIWGSAVINGRYRITNRIENIGKTGQVTGWVNASDIKPEDVTEALNETAGSEAGQLFDAEQYEQKIAELSGRLDIMTSAVNAIKAVVETL